MASKYTLEQVSDQLGIEKSLLRYLSMNYSSFLSYQKYSVLGLSEFSERDLKVLELMQKLYQNKMLNETNLQKCLKQADLADHSDSCRVLAFMSGKGGVGKTVSTVNLSIAMARLGLKVLLLDADLGLANAYIHLGVNPEKNLGHVLFQGEDWHNVLCPSDYGLDLISSGSGLYDVANLSSDKANQLKHLMRQLQKEYDVIMIDLGAGVSEQTIRFAQMADEVFVVTIPDVAALTDAYGAIKIVWQKDPYKAMTLLVNMADHAKQALGVFQRINECALRFLNKELGEFLWLPRDDTMSQWVARRKPIITEQGGVLREHFEQMARTICEHSVLKLTAAAKSS